MRRDPVFIRKILRLAQPFLRIFRCEVHGLQDLAPGPFLFIANHNIGAAVEVLALLNAWENQFQGTRPVFGLTHRFALKIPLLRNFFAKLGCVPASFDSAKSVLGAGHSLIIFPGGNEEAVRPFSKRWQSDLGGHRGWIKIAHQERIRVIPIAIAGSHHVNPVLFHSQILSTLMLIPRWLGVRYFPVTVSQIIWSLLGGLIAHNFCPWWLTTLICYWLFLSTPLHPIWPHKIIIRVFAPIEVASLSENEAYRIVQDTIQSGMRPPSM